MIIHTTGSLAGILGDNGNDLPASAGDKNRVTSRLAMIGEAALANL
jgi:hypothetical protein